MEYHKGQFLKYVEYRPDYIPIIRFKEGQFSF